MKIPVGERFTMENGRRHERFGLVGSLIDHQNKDRKEIKNSEQEREWHRVDLPCDINKERRDEKT